MILLKSKIMELQINNLYVLTQPCMVAKTTIKGHP